MAEVIGRPEKMVKRRAQPVFLFPACPECGEGAMRPIDDRPSNPMVAVIKVKHSCDKCGNEEWYTKRYPELSFEEMQKPPDE